MQPFLKENWSLPSWLQSTSRKFWCGKLEGNISEQNYFFVDSSSVTVTSPVQNRNKLEWTWVSKRQRQCWLFLAPTCRVLALKHTTHSSLSVAHLFPRELEGEDETPSFPKAVLSLHLPAQVHWVHHCSACSRGKVMQAPRTHLHLAGRRPKESTSPLPTYTDQELPMFGSLWSFSLLFALSNLNTSFLLLINTMLAYSASDFHWITSRIRQSSFLLGLEEANMGGHTPVPGWSQGMQTAGSVEALQNMVPSAHTSKYCLVC